MMKVEIKTTQNRIGIQFYDNADCLLFVNARLDGNNVKVSIVKSMQIPYTLTPAEAREYADILSLLAETAEMVTKKITGPEDFDKNWTARLVGDVIVILEEANETPP